MSKLMGFLSQRIVNLNYNFRKDRDSANLLYALFYLDHLIPDLEVS